MGVGRHFLICILIIGAVLFVYGQVRGFDFISFDDSALVYDNPDIRNGFTLKGIARSFSLAKASGPYWHPVTSLSHMADVQLFGLDSGKHHLTNLVIHILNVILLYTFLFRVTGKVRESLFVALLFALHPLNVESVAWITQRKNLLAGFFWMLGLNIFLLYTELKKHLLFILLCLVFLLGYMSKPVMMTFPFTLLILNYWPLNRYKWKADNKKGTAVIKQNLKCLLEVFPMLLMMVGIFLYWYMNYSDGFGLIGYDSVPLYLRLLNALTADVIYIVQLFYPVNLSVFYPFPETVPVWKSVGAILILICVTGTGIRYIRTMPWLAAGWFWYLGNLVTASGLMQRGYWPAHADRFVYIPMIGLFILIVWTLSHIEEQYASGRRKSTIILAAFIGLLGIKTFQQTAYWENGLTLFTRAIKVNPSDSLSYTNLAYVQGENGDTEAALRSSYKALELNPSNVEAHNNTGVLLASLGRYGESLTHFRNAGLLFPGFTDAMLNEAAALYKLDRLDESEAVFLNVLAKNPGNKTALMGLGDISYDRGEFKKAVDYFAVGIGGGGAHQRHYLRYGESMLAIGKPYKAVRFFEKTSKKTEDRRLFFEAVGNLFRQYGYPFEADRFYLKAEDGR